MGNLGILGGQESPKNDMFLHNFRGPKENWASTSPDPQPNSWTIVRWDRFHPSTPAFDLFSTVQNVGIPHSALFWQRNYLAIKWKPHPMFFLNTDPGSMHATLLISQAVTTNGCNPQKMQGQFYHYVWIGFKRNPIFFCRVIVHLYSYICTMATCCNLQMLTIGFVHVFFPALSQQTLSTLANFLMESRNGRMYTLGMVINPLVGIDIPSTRIPIMGWTCHRYHVLTMACIKILNKYWKKLTIMGYFTEM